MGKAIGAVFTAIVAPVLVILVTQHFNKQDKKDDKGKSGERHKPGHAAQPAGTAAPVAPSGKQSAIVAEGVGYSNEEATQNAFRNVVASAVTALVGADAYAHNSALITAQVLPQSEAYISHYDVKAANQEKTGGHDTYHKRIAATVDRRGLANALKALHIMDKN